MRLHLMPLLALLMLTSAQAQQAISREGMLEALSAPTTRSLRNLAVAPRRIDLTVNFDFGSPRLQESSKPQLDVLAGVMLDARLSATTFKVEGHTDAKGKPEFNLALSEKRAVTVMEYLMAKGVPRERLAAVGKGATELLLPDEPEAAGNRRVRIAVKEAAE